jgi:hypothetical protein
MHALTIIATALLALLAILPTMWIAGVLLCALHDAGLQMRHWRRVRQAARR